MALEKIKEKIKSGGFKDEEKPYKKGSTKSPPKKADHKHEYEPVLLAYLDKYHSLNKDHGWVSGISHYPGSRCKICQRLTLSFPKNSELNKRYKYGFVPILSRDLVSEFPTLPIIPVKDIWNL